MTYIRLHGRNAAHWWEHDEAEDRYDYLYSPDELRPVADAAKIAATVSKRVLVYFNNHFSAKAVANAAVLKHDLGQTGPGDYPPEMVDRYPELEGIVASSGLPLLRDASYDGYDRYVRYDGSEERADADQLL